MNKLDRIEKPSQQELIEAIIKNWQNKEAPNMPHAAWAVYAAYAVEKLMGWK